MRPAFLFEQCRVRELSEEDLLRDRELAEADPELLSVLNVNEPDDYERARSRAAPSVTVRRYGTLATNLGREPIAIRAATLEAAAAAAGLALDRHVVAALNGDQITRHPELPLAGGDEIGASWRRTREAEDAGPGYRRRLVRIQLEGDAFGSRRCAARARRRPSLRTRGRLGRRRRARRLRAARGRRTRTTIRSTCSTASRLSTGRTRVWAAAGSAISATTSALGSSASRLPRRGACRCPTSRSPSTTTSSTSTPTGDGGSRRCGRTSARRAATRASTLFRAPPRRGSPRAAACGSATSSPRRPAARAHHRDRRMPRADRRRRDLPGQPCLRLEAEWKGDPLDLFARTAGTLEPRHARRGRRTMGRRLQPLPRALPAPPRPRGA